MSTGYRLFLRGFCILLASMLLLAGCKSLRLPSIDQQGRGLFAPLGETTEVLNPLEDGFSELGLPSWPTPAFQNPPGPEDCRPPRYSSQLADNTAPLTGTAGEVRILPAVVAAPIGMEVILRGVIFDNDGHYAHAKPLEWSLPENSVGQFSDVGGGNPPFLERIIPAGSRVLEQRLASSKTSARSESVRRGTGDESDDIHVERGQSWLAVSSDIVGTSQISLAAPQVSDWSKQPAEATIYWLDVAWLFPTPQLVAPDTIARLETRITTTRNAPLAGWTVRYTLPQTSDVQFEARNQQVLDVATDATGVATANIQPATPYGQQTRVLVEVLVPAEQVGGRQMILARHWAHIRWSGNNLQLSVEAPSQVASGQVFDVLATIQNSGDQPQQDVELEALLPAGMQMVNSDNMTGDRASGYRWQIGELGPGQSHQQQFQAMLDSVGQQQFQLTANSSDQTSRAVVQLSGVRFPVQVEILSPQRVAKNQPVPVVIRLTNNSNNLLQRILLSDELADGLVHLDPNQVEDPQARTLEFTVDNLQPGETVEKTLDLKASQIGRLCHTLTVTLDDGLTSRFQGCLDVSDQVTATPVSLQLIGPPALRVGQTASYRLRVSNQSTAALAESTLSCRLPASVELIPTNPAQLVEDGSVQLQLASVAVGEVQDLEFQLRGTQVSAPAPLTGSLRTPTGELQTTILSLSVLANELEAIPDSDLDRTGLTLTVTSISQEIVVGQPVQYEIIVRNDRDFSDKNIQLKIELPDGLELVKFSQPHQGEPQLDARRQTIIASQVRELLPREQLRPFRLEVIPRQAGQFQLKVSVQSARSDSPQWVNTETVVSDNK